MSARKALVRVALGLARLLCILGLGSLLFALVFTAATHFSLAGILSAEILRYLGALALVGVIALAVWDLGGDDHVR